MKYSRIIFLKIDIKFWFLRYHSHIIIDNHEVSSQKLLSFSRAIDWCIIWHVLRKNRVWGGTQEVDPQISSWYFVPGCFRLRWLRIWQLKSDPTTCSACSERSAYGSSEKFYFRYSAWEKFEFGIKMLTETIWARFWKDLVETTPNKEVMVEIVKHTENVILILRFF